MPSYKLVVHFFWTVITAQLKAQHQILTCNGKLSLGLKKFLGCLTDHLYPLSFKTSAVNSTVIQVSFAFKNDSSMFDFAI